MYKITQTIYKVCKKLKIKYKSPNFKELKQSKIDAKKLVKIYTDLKIICGDLEEFKDRYPELKEDLTVDTFDISKTSHHLIVEIQKILKHKETK